MTKILWDVKRKNSFEDLTNNRKILEKRQENCNRCFSKFLRQVKMKTRWREFHIDFPRKMCNIVGREFFKYHDIVDMLRAYDPERIEKFHCLLKLHIVNYCRRFMTVESNVTFSQVKLNLHKWISELVSVLYGHIINSGAEKMVFNFKKCANCCFEQFHTTCFVQRSPML